MALVDQVVATEVGAYIRRLSDLLVGYVEAGDARNIVRTLFLIHEAVSPAVDQPVGRVFMRSVATKRELLDMHNDAGEFPPELREVVENLRLVLTSHVEELTGKTIDELAEEQGQ